MGILTRPPQLMIGDLFGVNIKDFGPPGMVGNGDPVYDGPAFKKAETYLNTNTVGRGGALLLPAGIYRPTETFDSDNFDLVSSIYVVGEGEINTQVFGDAMPTNTDVFSFNTGVHFGIKGMMIVNAKRNGLRIKGGTFGGTGYSSVGWAKELRIQSSVSDGLYSENSYLLTLDDIWSRDNGGCGFNFKGFHTSVKMGKCYAWNHANAPGFQCNAMVYSSMTTCASDSNKWGYSFTNVAGFAMIGCGAEANQQASILLRADGGIAAGNPVECQDISALTIQGGFFLHGNSGNADGAYPSFIDASAAGNRSIYVSLISNKSIKNTAHANDKTIAGSAAVGSTVRFYGLGNTFDAANSFGGGGTAEFVGS